MLGFSDLQAGIAADIVRAGVQVHVFNQRSVGGIFEMIAMLAAMVGALDKGRALIERLRTDLDGLARKAARLPLRPRVYFEEWDDPLISCIAWVSELIALAGGEDCFAELANSSSAKGRIIADPAEVIRRAPDIIVGSLCGKRFRPERVRSREGWADIPAVRDGQLYEIKSADILQPGPAALTDGVRRLHDIICCWAEAQR